MSAFSSVDGGKKVSGRTTIGFIDAEGQGDQDVTYDAKLVCPILLASKCVLYNYKGELHKDKLLETLGIMGRAARNVGSDPSIKRGQKKFSHLHIVFRDWQFESGEAAVQQAFARIFELEGTRESQTRDAIRQEVLDSFESVRVWLFDTPTDTSKLRGKLTLGVTSAAFRQQLREFRHALSQQMSEPLNFAGRPLTGRTVAPLMKSIVSSLNDGGSVLPDSAFANMMRAELEQLRNRLDKQINLSAQEVLGNITAKSQEGPNSFIASEPEATAALREELDGLVAAFEVDKLAAVGEITDDLARRVVGDTAAEVLRIRGNVERSFITAYQAAFGSWLRGARQRAEEIIATLALNMLSRENGLTTTALETTFSTAWDDATGVLGVSRYSSSDTTKESVDDVAQQVRRVWTAEFEKAISINEKRQQQEKARIKALLAVAITKMEGVLQSEAQALSTLFPTGFPRSTLEEKLNEVYHAELAALQTAAAGGSFSDSVEENFEDACKRMRPLLIEIYAAGLDSALQRTLDSAKGKISSSLAEMGYLQVGKIHASMCHEVMRQSEGWGLDHAKLQERVIGPLTTALFAEAQELQDQQEQLELLESMDLDPADDNVSEIISDSTLAAGGGVGGTEATAAGRTKATRATKSSRKSVATPKRPKKKSTLPPMPTVEEQLALAAQFKASYAQPAATKSTSRRKSMAPATGKQAATAVAVAVATAEGTENVPPAPPLDRVAAAKETAMQKQKERQAAAVAALGERNAKKK